VRVAHFRCFCNGMALILRLATPICGIHDSRCRPRVWCR